MLGVRQRHLGDLAAELLDPLRACLEDGAHAGVDRRRAESSAGTPKRSPFRSSRLGASTPPSIPTEVESQGSRPCIAASSSAASVTSRVSGPHWSSEEAKAIIP